MKFYRSVTEFLEITDTSDMRLKDVLGKDYGYINDFAEFSDRDLLEFSKSSGFVIFTNGDLLRDDVIQRNDRSCQSVKSFADTNTEAEQWRYYKSFLEHEKKLRYKYKKSDIKTSYVAIFEEVGVVTLYYDNGFMMTEQNGETKDIIPMSQRQWEKLVLDLQRAGQLKGNKT